MYFICSGTYNKCTALQLVHSATVSRVLSYKNHCMWNTSPKLCLLQLSINLAS